jgi:hypothetical protein
MFSLLVADREIRHWVGDIAIDLADRIIYYSIDQLNSQEKRAER